MSTPAPTAGTLLIADDNRVNRLLLARGLEQEGHTIVFAEHGREALDLLRQQQGFDLVLLDVLMPELDGYKVLAELKGMPRLKNIPVVVLTTSDAEQDIVMSYNLHANCYITKPVDLDKFIEIIRGIENFWLSIVKLPPM